MYMLNLEDPISKVPLIGPKYEKLLSKLEIYTIKDLLYHFPFRYEDFSHIKKIKDLKQEEKVTVIGIVDEIKVIYTKNGKRLTKLILIDDTGAVEGIWFNQPYLIQTIKKGMNLALSGTLTTFDNNDAFISPEYEIVQRYGNEHTRSLLHTGRLVPIYPETYGVTSKWLRSRINFLLNEKTLQLEEFLPEFILREHKFLNLKDALTDFHFPSNFKKSEEAKKRFTYEELFELILKSETRKESRKNLKAVKSFAPHNANIEALIKTLPFTLTLSQKTTISEIIQDLTHDKPMNRLLQGDVGSGKTIIALISAYLTHLNGCKTYFMAPTEILANQHYETFKKFLHPLGIAVSLTTGSQKDTTDASINIGTHALLYNTKNKTSEKAKTTSKTTTQNSEDWPLGLVIIDEQHRFGVEQRIALTKSHTQVQNNLQPHLLTMTATPIPRTLALTLYGDLDISSLTEMPLGRQKVTTWVVPNTKREKAYTWIKEQITLSKGKNQVFIVCPLIEESEKETMQNIKAATQEFEKLSKTIFKNFKVGLIHGKLKPTEKDKIITDFRNGKLHILIATPVIEVGVDISNATIIVIEGAERFGLASLHQIRGRVGRGSEKSYCMLFTESKNPKVTTRLLLLETKHNGLELAEMDLKLRGQGDITGTMQHGVVKLKLADITDLTLIKAVKEDATKTLPEIRTYPKLLERIKYNKIASAN